MARTNDPHSATAQFFINLVDNKRLDHIPNQSAGYAVFGKVVKGEDVVKKMAKVETTTVGFHADVPKSPITIKKVSIIE
jgi:cyclophilin family peptidyl-prolyl cis-trans isomerase